MTPEEFEALKATFPWTERTIHTRTGAVVQVLDNRGAEVSIFTMTRFLSMITTKLAAKPAEQEGRKNEQ